MQPLRNDEIFGTWCTLLLPVNPDNSINFLKLESEIDILISSKVNGIYSNGTAGEFDSQTEKEFDQINFLLAERCNKASIPFQIGCSHTSPVISLERVKRAVKLNPGAIQVILPDWYPPNMNEIVHYLQKIAQAAHPVGLVLYNPPHAKRILQPEDYRHIAQESIPLLGCKVGSREAPWYAEMKNLVPELSLFVPGHALATGVQSGANGSYSNVACLSPKMAQQWYEMMNSDIEKALELEKRIQLFINNNIIPYITEKNFSSQAIDKFLAAIGGWADIGTRLRWPYEGLDENEVMPVREKCKLTLPESFL
ncbi:MAG: dihydrodipicolinate synthase family protein [Chitinophagaceae bacterium]|nr:MAG: dihydrodipicolinate synthase family protein [Chitinophagaceae bacterium]